MLAASPPLAAVVASAAIPPFFFQIVALLVAAAAIAYVSNRFGLVPIVGFLIAGVVIGPHGIALVKDGALVDAAAEIGVVLLLFTIGIEFSLEKLARIQRLIFLGGGLQVGLAMLVTMAVLLPFGIDWRAGLFTGMLVALSSTAIVLKLLANRGETNAPHGQVGLGLLIFQDLAIVVMVLLIPALAGRGSSPLEIGIALAKAAGIIALVLVVARRIMPSLLDSVAKTCSPEIFLLTVIALCFGTAYLTSLAGVSLSLGAFLAGLLVSESRFSEYALGEILPLQVLFSATFFVSVGMLLDLGFLTTHLPLVLGAIAIVLVVKVATTMFAVRALAHPLPVAAASGLMLAQVGEFSFVLERAGRTVGLTPAGLGDSGSQTFIASTVVLMAATPFLTAVGARSAEKIERKLTAAGRAESVDALEPESVPEHVLALQNHVIVAGYGEAARRLTRVLHGSGIPFVVTTLSPGGALEAEADGLPVMRGDATRQRTLVLAGIERAKVLVIPDDDPATAHRIAKLARSIVPQRRIVVRTRFMSEIEALGKEGVDLVVAEELEGIVALFREVLRDFDVSPAEIEAHEDAVRRGGYAALREGEDGVMADTKQSIANAFASTAALPRPHGAVAAVAEAPAQSAERVSARRGVDVETTIRFSPQVDATVCSHLESIRPVRPSARGCEDCLRIGDSWLHLRVCLTCGHVGCCDSSKNRHARAHWKSTRHPLMRSLEPGETWGWCFEDEAEIG